MKQYPYPKEPSERRERLKAALTILKEKFVGIDEQIESIVDRVTFWYVHPDKVNRPLVVNLWGPTGVGKTDVVRDLKSILGFDDMYVEQVFSNHESSSDLVVDIQEHCMDMTLGRPGIMAFDEFQRYQTKGNDGSPIRGLGYKDVWQILSDGVVVDNIPVENLHSLCESFGYTPGLGFRLSDSTGSIQEMLDEMSGKSDPVNRMMEYLPKDREVNGEFSEEDADSLYGKVAAEDAEKNIYRLQMTKLSTDPVIKKTMGKHFKFADPDHMYYLTSYYRADVGRIADLAEDTRKVSKFLINKGYEHDGTLEGILEATSELLEGTNSMNVTYENDFRKTLIFVIGNLDNVYREALFTSSPSVPADTYREWCDSISIFDVKEELSDLFFPEQVARLGNTHIIYPTLGEEHFKEIIRKNLHDQVMSTVDGVFTVVDIESSVYHYVYRNGVYPIQGVRPVFSSISDTCNAILSALYQAEPTKPVAISYNTEDGLLEIDTVDPGESYVYPLVGDRDRVANKIRGLRDYAVSQSIHEMGHAAAHYNYFGTKPTCCYLEENQATTIISVDYALNFEASWAQVVIALAGYAAVEASYFDMDANSGHQSDLRTATESILVMIREHGWLMRVLDKVGASWWKKRKLAKRVRALNPAYSIFGEKDIDSNELVVHHSVEYKLVVEAINTALNEARALINSPGVLRAIKYNASALSRDLFISGYDIETVFRKNFTPTSLVNSIRTK